MYSNSSPVEREVLTFVLIDPEGKEIPIQTELRVRPARFAFTSSCPSHIALDQEATLVLHIEDPSGVGSSRHLTYSSDGGGEITYKGSSYQPGTPIPIGNRPSVPLRFTPARTGETHLVFVLEDASGQRHRLRVPLSVTPYRPSER